MSYGDNETEKLLRHGKDHTDIYKGKMLHHSADLVTDKILAEWASFKEIMFEHCLFQSSVDKKIAKDRSKCNKSIDKAMEGVYTSCIFQWYL